MLPIAEDRRHPFGICIWCSRLKNKPKTSVSYCVNNKRHMGPNVKSIIHETFDFLSPYNVRGERNLTLQENDSYSQATINVYHYRHVAYIFFIYNITLDIQNYSIKVIYRLFYCMICRILKNLYIYPCCNLALTGK